MGNQKRKAKRRAPPCGHLEAVVDGADPPARGPSSLQLLLPVDRALEPVHVGVTPSVTQELLHL